MPVTIQEISSTISAIGPRITAFGVKRLGLFGSTARGDNNDESDLDFLVEFRDGGKTFDNFMELSFLLEDVLHRKVDLVTPESLSARMRESIAREVLFLEV
jgi:uncharacterized protein